MDRGREGKAFVRNRDCDRAVTVRTASTRYTLTIITWAVVVFTPVVLAYEVWMSWVFRRRIGRQDIPAATGLPARRPEVPAL